MQNVLALGHGGGGLALRSHLGRSGDERISGLVLVGTPNQGGSLLGHFLRDNASTPSEAEVLVGNLTAFRSTASGCQDCNQLSRFQQLFGALNDDFLTRPSVPGSSILRQLPTVPPVPTVVMYGDLYDSEYPFSRVESGGSASNTGVGGLEQCVRDFTSDERARFEAEFGFDGVRNITTFSKIVSGLLGAISDPSKLATALHDLQSSITDMLQRAKQKNIAKRELLECEYVNQAINAEWLTWTIDPASEIIEVPTFDEECCYADCVDDYTEYGDVSDWVYGACLAQCESFGFGRNDCERVEAGTIPVRVPSNPTDGVYYFDEMVIDGSLRTYVIPDTDHRSEMSGTRPANLQVYNVLFSGEAGAAFRLDPR